MLIIPDKYENCQIRATEFEKQFSKDNFDLTLLKKINYALTGNGKSKLDNPERATGEAVSFRANKEMATCDTIYGVNLLMMCRKTRDFNHGI